MKCFLCHQPTHKHCSRVVWLKDRGIERRLCVACLKARGLSLVPRYRLDERAPEGGQDA